MDEIGGIDRVDNSGETALQRARERGHLEIVRLLVEEASDANTQKDTMPILSILLYEEDILQ